MKKIHGNHRSLWRGGLLGFLLAVLTASLVFAAGSWSLGPYQLVGGTPSGPLQATMRSGSLSSYGFVGGVGGVAFAGVADLGPSLAGKPLRLVYEKSKPDGERFGIEVDGVTYFQSLPDWILIPVARYADSPYNACVSLFGPKTTESHYDIVYHQAFENTLLGMRLLQADMLLFDLSQTWQLPRQNGKIVLGAGETELRIRDKTAARELSSALSGGTFQSWVLTDESETIQVDLMNGKLQLTGLPYYHFWISDFEAYEREILTLKRRADKLLTSGDIAGYNQVVERANRLEPQVRAVTRLTAALKGQQEMLRRYNPPVYDAVTKTMRYAALFRYVKYQSWTSWQTFIDSLQSTSPQPNVTTPVRWARPR